MGMEVMILFNSITFLEMRHERTFRMLDLLIEQSMIT